MINHTIQRETSHSQNSQLRGKFLNMTESEIFRANLLRLMEERGLKEAELSKMAKLNPRAVTDIREGRTVSPKLSTVFALAKALEIDPGELMGLAPQHQLKADLAKFLSQYSEDDQERFLNALQGLPRLPA